MIIDGTSGNDTLYDVGNRDILTGGLGADTFVLSHDGQRDTITDFQDGVDVIDFTDFNVTFEELFIFQLSAYSFVIDIRGERNQIDVPVPNLGDPTITPYSFTAADFIFASGAGPMYLCFHPMACAMRCGALKFIKTKLISRGLARPLKT